MATTMDRIDHALKSRPDKNQDWFLSGLKKSLISNGNLTEKQMFYLGETEKRMGIKPVYDWSENETKTKTERESKMILNDDKTQKEHVKEISKALPVYKPVPKEDIEKRLDRLEILATALLACLQRYADDLQKK